MCSDSQEGSLSDRQWAAIKLLWTEYEVVYLSCHIEYQGRLWDPAGTAVESLEFYKGHSPLMGATQGFIQDFQLGGGGGGGEMLCVG